MTSTRPCQATPTSSQIKLAKERDERVAREIKIRENQMICPQLYVSEQDRSTVDLFHMHKAY